MSNDAGSKILEYFSVKDDNHAIAHGLYLASVLAEELETKMIEPLSWLVAANLLGIYGETELSNTAKEKLSNWIQINSL